MRLTAVHPLLLLTLAAIACDEGPVAPPDSVACEASVGTLAIAAIPLSDTDAGTLSAASCKLSRGSFADRWEFTLTVPANIEILIASDDFDPFLVLRDADDKYVTSDDDDGPDTDARLSFPMSVGTYYIFPTTYAKETVGSYTITINSSTPP